MSPKELRRQIAERKAADKGFAGREALVDALYESPAISQVLNQKIMAANIVRETVLSLVSAVRAKNALETLIVNEAELILSARIEKAAERKVSRKVHDLSTPAGVLSAALEEMNVNGEIRLLQRRDGSNGTYSIFAINTDKGEERAMLNENVMSSPDPVQAASDYLRQQGFARETPGNRGGQILKRRAADLVELTREDLDSRKIGFQGKSEVHGSEEGMPNHFTYFEEGMETTITARPDIKGRELLCYLENRIVQLHTAAGRSISSDVAEAIAEGYAVPGGISKLQDPGLRKVSRTVFTLANSFEETLIPVEYRNVVEAVKNSREFQEFGRYFNEGLFTNEEIREFRLAFDKIDHPGHLLVRQMHAQMIDDKGEISDDDKEALRITLSLHDGQIEMPESALRAVADAYSMISNENAQDWDPERLGKKYLTMVTSIRMAVRSLSSGFKVVRNDEEGEESFGSD